MPAPRPTTLHGSRRRVQRRVASARPWPTRSASAAPPASANAGVTGRSRHAAKAARSSASSRRRRHAIGSADGSASDAVAISRLSRRQRVGGSASVGYAISCAYGLVALAHVSRRLRDGAHLDGGARVASLAAGGEPAGAEARGRLWAGAAHAFGARRDADAGGRD